MSSRTPLQTNDFKKSRSAELVPPPVIIPTRSLPHDDAVNPSWEDGGPTDLSPRLHYREYRPTLPPNFSSVDFGILFDPDETSRVKIIIRGISCCESGWKKNITFWVIAKELLRQGDPHRLRLQLQIELALPQGTVLDWLQSKRLLDFVGEILYLSVVDIRTVDLDLRMMQATLPHSVTDKQVMEPFLDPQGLLELTSFKFGGSLRCNIPQPWRSLDSISIVAKSLTTLCLDNLDDEGLNLLDCIEILYGCEHLQEFSVNRLVGDNRQSRLLSEHKFWGQQMAKSMDFLSSLRIFSSHDISDLLLWISFPRIKKLSLRLVNQSSMQKFRDHINWRSLKESRLYCLASHAESQDIVNRLSGQGKYYHTTLNGGLLDANY